MADYTEMEVTGMDADEFVNLINDRIRRFHSVEIFRRGRKTILRTWRVELDVSEFEGEAE